jgi:hypothetical protein
MTLPSKAHVKIGPHEYELAEQVGSGASTFLPHYKHIAETLLAGRTDISGKPGRQNIRTEILFYAQDSWVDGLGQKFRDPNQPFRYYRGNGNPRNDGLLAATPTRRGLASPTGDYISSPVFASGGGFLYMADSDKVPVGHFPTVYQTSDFLTWNSAEVVDGADGFPNWNRVLCCDQNGNAYLLSGGPTQFGHIIRVKSDLSSVVFTKEATHPTGSHLGPRGAATHEKFLYAWTGVSLYQWDMTAALYVDPTFIGSSGVDNVSGFIATADIINCGDGLVMFTSQPGRSIVYQYRRNVSGVDTPAFSQMWMAPDDTILWSIAAMNGVVYVAGNQDRGVSVWGIDLATNKATQVLRISPDQEEVLTL